MGESGIHVIQILDLLAALYLHFRDRPDVYVGANMFMYWDETDPHEVLAPDVFVALGVAPTGFRRTWKTWEEGKAPDVIFEITSKKTRRADLHAKRALYEELGVREYFLFDPLDEYLKPRLQGFRLSGGRLQPLSGERLTSEVLGMELRVKDDNFLHLFNLQKGDWLPVPAELADQAAEAYYRAEGERARADEERARADEERIRAEEEHTRAEAAEAEVARLREELARLKGER